MGILSLTVCRREEQHSEVLGHCHFYGFVVPDHPFGGV